MNIAEFCDMVGTLKTTLSKYNFVPTVVMDLFRDGDFRSTRQKLYRVEPDQIFEIISSFISDHYLRKITSLNDIRFVEEYSIRLNNTQEFLYEVNLYSDTKVTIILTLSITVVV